MRRQKVYVLYANKEIRNKYSMCQRTIYQLFAPENRGIFACGLIVADGDLLVVDSGLLVVDGDLLVLEG